MTEPYDHRADVQYVTGHMQILVTLLVQAPVMSLRWALRAGAFPLFIIIIINAITVASIAIIIIVNILCPLA